MPPLRNPYKLPTQQADCICQWEDASRAYKLCTAVDTTLRNQFTRTVDETYLLSLKNQYTGYVQSMTIAILQHLYATYGRIKPTKLDKNNKAMKKDYDATLPIEHLAEQIETAVTIAGNTNQPYTAAQVLSIVYNLIFKTGVYKDACKEWRNKAAADKT
eukprot:7953550-Ditylum_brightwellii.AAC.2